MTAAKIRHFELSDVAEVVGMIRNSFDPDFWPFMVYTQHGIGEFLSVPLKYPGSAPERYAVVATGTPNRVGLRGYADFRLLQEGVGFLSYICVPPESRGEGIATRLVETFIANHPNVKELHLDVFRENLPARSLYNKMGFKVEDSTAWVTRDLPAVRDPLEIRSLATSIASEQVYGFCELEVVLNQSEIRVGILGRSVLRCFSEESFANDGLLGGMRRMFSELECAFAVVPEASLVDLTTKHKVINRSDRMVLNLRESKR